MPLSHPLILASRIFAISQNVIALYLCAFYVLFEYLISLFQKFTMFSPLSHPLILALPIFAISKNAIALHLCALQISNSRNAILKIYRGFAPESPSDFGITNFHDIKECNCATFVLFMCFCYILEPKRYFKKLPWFHPWLTLWFLHHHFLWY